MMDVYVDMLPISIHAPVKGATRHPSTLPMLDERFQSTLP